MIKTILSIFAILSVCFGTYFWLDDRYAKAQELKQIEQRLDYKITQDQAQSKQQRAWQIEDRYRGKQMPDTVAQEYRQLIKDEVALREKMKSLEKK